MKGAAKLFMLLILAVVAGSATAAEPAPGESVRLASYRRLEALFNERHRLETRRSWNRVDGVREALILQVKGASAQRLGELAEVVGERDRRLAAKIGELDGQIELARKRIAYIDALEALDAVVKRKKSTQPPRK